uniref:Natural killer cell lectin-like receptor n=1 Tax=Gopherus evgoodei TaxID=1825980 RepID=A0A8C4XZR7_9SAUR
MNVENEDSIQTSLSSFPTPEGSSCRLCPTEWLMHEGKCYWASKEKSKKWNESREDCSAKSSQMLMSQDQREMVKSIAGCGNFSWRVVEFDLSKRSVRIFKVSHKDSDCSLSSWNGGLTPCTLPCHPLTLIPLFPCTPQSVAICSYT